MNNNEQLSTNSIKGGVAIVNKGNPFISKTPDLGCDDIDYPYGISRVEEVDLCKDVLHTLGISDVEIEANYERSPGYQLRSTGDMDELDFNG